MTLLADLQAQSLPVVSVDAQNNITMGPMTQDQQRLYEAVLLHYFYPADYPHIVELVSTILNVKDNFQPTLDTLYAYSQMTNASLVDLREQMKFVTLLMWKLLKIYEVTITTHKE